MVTVDQVMVSCVHPDGVVSFLRVDTDYELDAWRNAAGWVDAESDEELAPGLSAVLDEVLRQHRRVTPTAALRRLLGEG